MKRKRIPTWVKNIVELEKGTICRICGKPIQFGEIYEIDHIYPVSKGGSNSLGNLQVIHKKCNRKKGEKKVMVSPDQWNVWWEQIQPNLDKLRDNQIEAYFRTYERLTDFKKYPDENYRIYHGGRPKIYCECTGAGKSILMLVLGFLLSKKKILIVTPSKVIRKNNFDALTDAYKIGIIPEKVRNEIQVTTLDRPNSLAYLRTADIVISTYQKLGRQDSDRVLANLRGDEFDVVLVDEAHHYKEGDKYIETIHRDIIGKFWNSIILFFTATPFDAKLNPILKHFDKQRDVIHEFTYADAWRKQYVKYFEWTEIKPEEQTLMITHPNGRTEKLKLSYEDIKEAQKISGYKSSLSKSKALKISLLHATVQLLDQRNEDLGNRVKKNIALIVTPNKKEAEDCKKLIESMNLSYKHCIIHSDTPNHKNILKQIKRNVYDIIISVDILKEGFDQKNITIVTLCRNIQSYVFFTQVIGRGVRSRKDIYGKPIPVTGHMRQMKDICYVVTHEGLKLRKLWDLFRELDLEDLVDEVEETKIRGEKSPYTDIVDVTPLVKIEDEIVQGYSSDGFDEGRTPRDETQAYFFRKAVQQSSDINLKRVIEDIWRKDEGITFSKYFQKTRSLDYAHKRNVPTTLFDEDDEDEKEDLQTSTTNTAKILQKYLRKHIVRCIRSRRGENIPWGKIMPIMHNTFYQIYKHPLKGGTTKSGYKLKPSDIDFINKEVPKLIENYRSFEYFKRNFYPTFKKNIEEAENDYFID